MDDVRRNPQHLARLPQLLLCRGPDSLLNALVDRPPTSTNCNPQWMLISSGRAGLMQMCGDTKGTEGTSSQETLILLPLDALLLPVQVEASGLVVE